MNWFVENFAGNFIAVFRCKETVAYPSSSSSSSSVFQ